MGIIRFFRSLANPKVLGEEIIDSIEKSFFKYNEKMKGEDIHWILAHVWLRRRRFYGEKFNNELSEATAMNETFLFACIPPPMCAKALGIYMIRKEAPQVIEKHPEFLEEFNRIMAPVLEAADDGSIDSLYKKYNPNLST